MCITRNDLANHVEIFINAFSTNSFIDELRQRIYQRYNLRNSYYHRTFRLIHDDLSSIKTHQKHLQFIEQQSFRSIQFFRNIFNIQTFTDINTYHQYYQQSIDCFNDLKDLVQQYENDIDEYKTKIIEQTQQIHFYSNNLCQIESEQKTLRTNIKHINEQILFENKLYNELKLIHGNPSNIFNEFDVEYVHLCNEISQIKLDLEQISNDLYQIHNKSNTTKVTDIQSLILPVKSQTNNHHHHQAALIMNKTSENMTQSQLPIEIVHQTEFIQLQSSKTDFLMSKTRLTPTLTTSRSYSLAVSTTTNNSEQSLGPNIQSRLEALEVAMGVRLNLAKSQGRQSLVNNPSPSPMQLSPTTSSSKKTLISTRLSQGIQRSASSCDVDNRSGPSKRLKPSIPNENLSPSSSSTAAAIATIKKYPPSARRPLLINTTANQTPYRKSPPMIKQRTSPMETSSPRLSRASTASTTSSSYRTPVGGISPVPTASPSRPPTANTRKRSMSVFGEQFSSEILKLNLLWIDLKELDDDSRSEVILQFGSIEHFLCEQNLFFHKQQQQSKLAAKHKTMINRSHLHLSLSKKDRLELL